MLNLGAPNFSASVRYGFAFLAVVLASLLRAVLAPVLGDGVPFILFYPTVLLSAWFGGFWPGLLSVLLGALAAVYAFMPPYFAVAVSDAGAVAQLIIFLISGTFMSLLAESMRQATQRAQEGEIRQRELHERYRVMLASIGDAVIATDTRGRLTFMNGVAEILTGWKFDEASGRPLDEIFQIVNEQTRQKVENPALRALEQGYIVGIANHTVLIARDGTEHAIDDSAAPIYIAEHGVAGAVLVFRDISQRRAVEREIWESRERLRITLGSIGDAVVATDAEGKITYINPTAESLLGYDLESTTGKPLVEIFNIVNEFTRQSVENPVARVLRDGDPVGLANHTVLLRPDGVSIPIDDSAAPIRDNSGKVVGAVLIFRDISERRRAQKSQATLAAIIDSSEDAIVSKNLDGRITTWNAGAERLFGYRDEEVVGRSITLIIPPDHIDEEAVILGRIRRGERVEHYETVRVRKDGSRVDVSLTVSPVKAPDGAIIGASKIARDITDRRKMEQQLLEADRQKDNFIAILAHELRNPLSPIRNAVKILEIERPDDADLLFYCGLIDKEVMQINRLLEDLLDMSRITQGKFSLRKQRIDIVTAVNNAIENIRPMIEEAGHHLTIDLFPEPLMMDADQIRLVQVFSNLLNNAAKFTPPGGNIRVVAEREDGQAIIRVIDSGAGISAELMPKIFDMFVQGETIIDRTQSGLGLGLTLVRDIVEFHGGSIEARSNGPGHGSEFIVRLPFSALAEPTQITGSDPKPTLRPQASSFRIVVVDDNKNQLQTLQRLLQAMGHEVRIAHDGMSAMKLLTNFVPDIALIDLGLPKISGFELARWLRNQTQLRNVILVAQTGWGREEDRQRAREAGFAHHLVKPIDQARLAEILAQSNSE